MISDIKNVGFTFNDRVLMSKTNVDGKLSEWKSWNGSFQVALINDNYDYLIKIPNINHGDSSKLLDCSGVATWGRPAEEAAPINKYTSYQIKATYALLQFHYENGFGPKMGRIFDVTVNGETYFAFEQEALPQNPYYRYLASKHNVDDMDENAINTLTYNEHIKEGGFIDVYKQHNALVNYNNNHVLAPAHADQDYTIGYKADASIFFMKDGDDKPKCF